jgi:hypothetical protein
MDVQNMAAVLANVADQRFVRFFFGFRPLEIFEHGRRLVMQRVEQLGYNLQEDDLLPQECARTARSPD